MCDSFLTQVKENDQRKKEAKEKGTISASLLPQDSHPARTHRKEPEAVGTQSKQVHGIGSVNEKWKTSKHYITEKEKKDRNLNEDPESTLILVIKLESEWQFDHSWIKASR